MSDPRRPAGATPATGTTYEVRVRTHVAPALAASLARLVRGTVVPRHAVRRLAVIRDDEDDVVDLPAVVKRLTECDVTVLDVRRCRPPGSGIGRAP
jgi:hypothetical protein